MNAILYKIKWKLKKLAKQSKRTKSFFTMTQFSIHYLSTHSVLQSTLRTPWSTIALFMLLSPTLTVPHHGHTGSPHTEYVYLLFIPLLAFFGPCVSDVDIIGGANFEHFFLVRASSASLVS